MQLIKGINQLVAFSLEIVMLMALLLGGYRIGTSPVWKYSLATLLPAIAIVLWARWGAPRSAHRLHQPLLLVFELGLMLVSAALLYKTGGKTWAVWFGIVAIVSQVVALITED